MEEVCSAAEREKPSDTPGPDYIQHLVVQSLALAGGAANLLNPWAAAGAAAAGAFAGGWFGVKAERARVELVRQVQGIDARKVDRDYLRSEQFADLCRKYWNVAQTTSERERVALAARALTRASVAPDYRETVEEYFDVLASLSARERHVLAAAYRFGKDRPHKQARPPSQAVRRRQAEDEQLQWKFENMIAGERLLAHLPGMSADSVDAYLKRLERTGLLREFEAGLGNPGGLFYVTDYCKRMMVFLDLEDLARGWE